MTMKMTKTYGPIRAWRGENPRPTRKLADQLTVTAMLMTAEIELFEPETECYLVAVGLPD